MILKEDADFRNECFPLLILCGGNFDTCHQVFLSVRAEHPYRELGTRKDHRFVQAFQHKTQGGGCISHRIRSVQNDEAMIEIIVLMNNVYQLSPHIGFHVRRVHRRVKLISINREVEFLQFGDMPLELLEVEVLQCACCGVFNHSNCSTGVY